MNLFHKKILFCVIYIVIIINIIFIFKTKMWFIYKTIQMQTKYYILLKNIIFNTINQNISKITETIAITFFSH